MVDDETYARAVLQHTDHVLQMFVGERLINKIFARVSQSHAMGRLVIAHFDWKAGVAAPPTLAQLQAQTIFRIGHIQAGGKMRPGLKVMMAGALACLAGLLLPALYPLRHIHCIWHRLPKRIRLVRPL